MTLNIKILLVLMVLVAGNEAVSSKPIFRKDSTLIEIHVRASGALSKPKPFQINIYKSKRNIKIVYKVVDSISYKLLSQNKEFVKASDLENKWCAQIAP